MSDAPRLNRRSFLTSVAGAAAGGLALTAVAGPASAARCRVRTGRTDRDGRSGDAPGCGTRTGLSDRDGTDRPGRGRGPQDGDSAPEPVRAPAATAQPSSSNSAPVVDSDEENYPQRGGTTPGRSLP